MIATHRLGWAKFAWPSIRVKERLAATEGIETILGELSRLEVHKLDRITAHLGIAHDPGRGRSHPRGV